jgi:hypothetical protein
LLSISIMYFNLLSTHEKLWLFYYY